MSEDESDYGSNESDTLTAKELAKAGFKQPRICYRNDELVIRQNDSELRLDDGQITEVLNGSSPLGEKEQELVRTWYSVSAHKIEETFQELDNLKDSSTSPLEKHQIWSKMEELASQHANKERILKEISFCYDVKGERAEQLYRILRQDCIETISLGSLTVGIPLKHFDKISKEAREISSHDDYDFRNFFGDLTIAHNVISKLAEQVFVGDDGTPYNGTRAFAKGKLHLTIGDTPVSLEARIGEETNTSGIGGQACTAIRINGLGLTQEQFYEAMNKSKYFKQVFEGSDGIYTSHNYDIMCHMGDFDSDIVLHGTPEKLEKNIFKMIEYLLTQNGRTN
ncbi:MAG: hypothetical protein EPN86_02380 [Nanoarchaeota archaeon]|nr:MAG: hypothetical protein EPN86_02380 [Nanoarchaeota archaeon]